MAPATSSSLLPGRWVTSPPIAINSLALERSDEFLGFRWQRPPLLYWPPTSTKTWRRACTSYLRNCSLRVLLLVVYLFWKLVKSRTVSWHLHCAWNLWKKFKTQFAKLTRFDLLKVPPDLKVEIRLQKFRRLPVFIIKYAVAHHSVY